MLKWFSFSGVTKEINKIRWPKREDLVENSVQTIIFTFFFGVFFVLCQFLVTLVLKGLGVI